MVQKNSQVKYPTDTSEFLSLIRILHSSQQASRPFIRPSLTISWYKPLIMSNAEFERIARCICITEPLCSTSETNSCVYQHHSVNKKFFKKKNKFLKSNENHFKGCSNKSSEEITVSPNKPYFVFYLNVFLCFFLLKFSLVSPFSIFFSFQSADK